MNIHFLKNKVSKKSKNPQKISLFLICPTNHEGGFNKLWKGQGGGGA